MSEDDSLVSSLGSDRLGELVLLVGPLILASCDSHSANVNSCEKCPRLLLLPCVSKTTKASPAKPAPCGHGQSIGANMLSALSSSVSHNTTRAEHPAHAATSCNSSTLSQ